MSFQRKLAALPLRLYPLYVRIAVITGLARLLILLVPCNRLALHPGKHLAPCSLVPADRQVIDIQEISLGITRIVTYIPWRCQCYEQGLTAKIMLQQIGLASSLVFGVARAGEKALSLMRGLSSAP